MAVKARLAAAFNANLAAAIADAAFADPVDPIDFTADSPNFYQGYLTPGQIASYGTISYPALVLYTTASVNDHGEKFRIFDGRVVVAIDAHLSFTDEGPPENAEVLGDVFEEAMVATFNAAAASDALQTAGALWNGDISCQRLPLNSADGQNWLQTHRYSLTFLRSTN